MMKNIKLFYALAVLLMISSLGFSRKAGLPDTPTQPVQADSPWSIPVAVSDPQVNAWFPDIIADTTGRVHLVWSGATVGYDQVIYSTSTDGTKWSPPNDILAIAQKTATYSDASRPALWVDKRGLLNVTYGSSKKFFAQSPISIAGSASSWTEPMVVNGDQEAYFASMVVDDKGALHVIYNENHPSNQCPICYHLYHRVSNDYGQTWSDAVDISVENNGAAKPQIVAGKNGALFTVWEAGVGGSLGSVQDPTLVKFAASYNQGKTWSVPVVFSPGEVKISKNVTIGIDSKGQLVVVWLDSMANHVYYQISTDQGKSWSIPGKIQGIYGAWDSYPSLKDDYSMAVDSLGNLHLLMVGKVKDYQTSLSVLHITWDGSAWSDPDEITRVIGDVPEWPRVAVGLGNVLHATWFVRDQANIWKSETGHYRVFYSRKVVAAPALPVVAPESPARPASDALISPTLAATPVPATAVPIATLSLSDKVSSKVIYSESDYLRVMAMSMIPVALFIVLAGVVFFIRRL